MEIVIFIIVWVIIGVMALRLGIIELEKCIVEIDNSEEIMENEESYKASIEEAKDKIADIGFNAFGHNPFVILLTNAVAIAIWPVLVPMLLYRVSQVRKGNMIL